MFKRIWINKPRSFKEAEEFERQYYQKMPAKERLETVQFLREIYHGKIKKDRSDACAKGLRRVVKVIQ